MKRFVPILIGVLLSFSCGKRPEVVHEKLDTGALTCEVTVYSPEIVRVVKYPVDGIGAAQKKSYSVVMEPQPVRVKRSETEQAVVLNTGKITVNGRDAKDYFGRQQLVDNAVAPLVLTETADRFDVFANMDGGGVTGQAGALRLGIAHAGEC